MKCLLRALFLFVFIFYLYLWQFWNYSKLLCQIPVIKEFFDAKVWRSRMFWKKAAINSTLLFFRMFLSVLPKIGLMRLNSFAKASWRWQITASWSKTTQTIILYWQMSVTLLLLQPSPQKTGFVKENIKYEADRHVCTEQMLCRTYNIQT